MARVWPPQNEDSPSFEFKAVCCCPVKAGPLECSIRSKDQSLLLVGCGGPWYDQFGGPYPDDGKRYLTTTYTGSIRIKAGGRTDLYTLTGSCSYDPVTGLAGTSTINFNWKQYNFPVPPGDEDEFICVGSPESPEYLSLDEDFPKECCQIDWGVGSDEGSVYSILGHVKTGSGVCTDNSLEEGEISSLYSVEDTWANALARMLAAQDWFAYSAISDDCSAFWDVPYDDEFGTYPFKYFQMARWRQEWTGLTPGSSYDVSIDIYRRAFDRDHFFVGGGGDPYTLYATQTETFVVDVNGKLTAEAEIPNDEGFQTIARGPATYVPTP